LKRQYAKWITRNLNQQSKDNNNTIKYPSTKFTLPFQNLTLSPAYHVTQIMDAADFFELHRTITFSVSHTTWDFKTRLSAYNNGATDSFLKAAVFEVQLAGSTLKVLPQNIPGRAVLKIRSQ
jgi:hypothetical protein